MKCDTRWDWEADPAPGRKPHRCIRARGHTWAPEQSAAAHECECGDVCLVG